MTWRYLILGSGVAGNVAMEELVNAGKKGEILMISADLDPPYDRPPLSKGFLRGKKSEAEVLYHPQSYYEENDIALLLNAPVENIDPKGKTVTANGETYGFEKLIVALGVEPRKLSIPGSDLKNILYLRSLRDSKALKDAAEKHKTAVIIGGGFIGMEVAAALLEKGLAVTIVNRGPWLWDRFVSQEIAGFFEGEYRNGRNITFLYGDEPVAFEGDEVVKLVKTKSGQTIPAEFVVVGIGTVLPEELCKTSGVDFENGLLVNEYLKTKYPDVWAVGDVTNYYDPIFKKRRRVEHWGHAEYTGRLAAKNALGEKQPYDLLTYVFSQLFDLHLEFAGDETGCEEIRLSRGSFAERSFTAKYLAQGKAHAYFQINGEEAERTELEQEIRANLAGDS